MPDESAIPAAPVVERVSQKVYVNRSDSMASVSPTDLLLPSGEDSPDMETEDVDYPEEFLDCMK